MGLRNHNEGRLCAGRKRRAPRSARVRRALAAYLLVVLSVVAGSPTVLGQSPSPSPSASPSPESGSAAGVEKSAPASGPGQQTPAPNSSGQVDDAIQAGEKRGSFIIAPIPISSPAFGSGLLLVTAYVFQFDKKDTVSSPSWVGAAAAITNNGSRGLALGSKVYLQENKYQATIAVITGRANLDFYGIGRIPGRPAVEVPLSMEGKIFFGEVMRNVGGNVFIGPRYQFRRLSATVEGDRREGGFVVPDIDIKSNSAALGFHIQRDRRDSTFWPTKGSLIDFTADFFDQAFGSRSEYQVYKVAYNGFRQVKERHVLAYRAMGCTANGRVPFYDLCLYGMNNDVRGYTTGEFQNRRMFAAQGEYRVDWKKRLGFVAFGGIGGVARTWGEFRSDGLLPGGGFGLRFKLDKKNHINYRIDVGVGRSGRTVTIGVGEAF